MANVDLFGSVCIYELIVPLSRGILCSQNLSQFLSTNKVRRASLQGNTILSNTSISLNVIDEEYLVL